MPILNGFPQPSGKGEFLPLSGGTMTGDIAMGNRKITGLADGAADTDAVNMKQLKTFAPLGKEWVVFDNNDMALKFFNGMPFILFKTSKRHGDVSITKETANALLSMYNSIFGVNVSGDYVYIYLVSPKFKYNQRDVSVSVEIGIRSVYGSGSSISISMINSDGSFDNTVYSLNWAGHKLSDV